jgi:hypothetical protein
MMDMTLRQNNPVIIVQIIIIQIHEVPHHKIGDIQILPHSLDRHRVRDIYVRFREIVMNKIMMTIGVAIVILSLTAGIIIILDKNMLFTTGIQKKILLPDHIYPLENLIVKNAENVICCKHYDQNDDKHIYNYLTMII